MAHQSPEVSYRTALTTFPTANPSFLHKESALVLVWAHGSLGCKWLACASEKKEMKLARGFPM